MLTPDQERIEVIGDQLRAKISSKFTASTFLGGFALTLLGGQVFTLWQVTELPRCFAAATGAVSAALVLFALSVVRLDELTMPKRFWRSDPSVVDATLPQHGLLSIEDLWALQNRMVFYWTRLTLAATAITAGAVILLLLPLTARGAQSVRAEIIWWVMAFSVLAFVYGSWVRHRAEKVYKPLVRPID